MMQSQVERRQREVSGARQTKPATRRLHRRQEQPMRKYARAWRLIYETRESDFEFFIMFRRWVRGPLKFVHRKKQFFCTIVKFSCKNEQLKS